MALYWSVNTVKEGLGFCSNSSLRFTLNGSRVAQETDGQWGHLRPPDNLVLSSFDCHVCGFLSTNAAVLSPA